MIIYKVYCKDYQLRQGNLLGVLAERRKGLRGKSELESGLRWARVAFGPSLKDKASIFVVPKELEAGNATRMFMEKGIFSKREFLTLARSNSFVRQTPIWKDGTVAKEIGKKTPRSSRTREIISYRWHYGFAVNPFEVLRDPKYLYLSPHYLRALTSVIEGIKKQVRIISIVGEPGTGKTTFIHLLLSSLGGKVKTVFISYPLKTFTEMLENILEELGLKPVKESREALLRQFHECLLQGVGGEQALVVIIDEAQSLSAELIADLGKLCDLGEKVQIVFVGQPELERKVNLAKLSQFRQEAGTRCRIKALSWKESKKYIDHRFKLAGSSVSEVYTPMALTMIIGYAGGFPRVIDTLCDNALIRGYQCFKKRIGVSIICEVISQMESQVPTKPIRARIIRVIGNVVQRYSL